MINNNHELILHQYATSPFSEKVRLMMGIKKLRWREVTVPMVMPKPELLSLTGGYRRTPVLQIGADVYCDSQLIATELEHRFPTASLFAGTDAGTATMLALASDRALFAPSVGLALAGRRHVLPSGFCEDRTQFIGREFSPERFLDARPMLQDQVSAQFAWIDAMLADGRPYLMGRAPTLVDCAVYHPCWFMRRHISTGEPPFADCTKLINWMDRVAAIGHGDHETLAMEQALGIAAASEPETIPAASAGSSSHPWIGQTVRVVPDDTGRVPTAGRLLAATRERISIVREQPELGKVHVHFPRAGFALERAV